jgi:hypothetical protein
MLELLYDASVHTSNYCSDSIAQDSNVSVYFSVFKKVALQPETNGEAAIQAACPVHMEACGRHPRPRQSILRVLGL